ncbi:MAG: rhodanese-like domain-containing protein [Verrucomicrobia bacterium]|nr:MAG: rhodanese-like domain-containing protein [Verrucomicrobiota bacterium]
MNALAQYAGLFGISALAGTTTFFITGPPSRVFVCNPSELKAGEICLNQLAADVPLLWIDARTRVLWQKNGMPGSILWNLDPTEDAASMEAEAVPHLLNYPRVVIYCDDLDCGLSEQVAQKIRALGLGNQVFALRGGWRALNEAGRVRGSNP